MSKLPKLKVQSLLGNDDRPEVCDLEQAKNRFDYDSGIIVVEGQVVSSYDELVRLAANDKYKGQEFLEVVLMPFIAGG